MEIKIKLKIKDVEIELDMEDIKELREILEEVCPSPKLEKEYVPISVPVPFYPPIIINPEPYKWDRWEITGTGFPPVDQPSITICYSGEE